MENCLFCRIVKGEVHADIIYQDDLAVAFRDISPQAPVHLLVIPRKHLATLSDVHPDDEALLGHLLWVGAHVAAKEGLATRGFRTVINTQQESGQTVFHLHLHILGGRPMNWPPG
jgi:histidine triad (HIT) family protein